MRFQGLLDNVRVYDRALSGDELRTDVGRGGAAHGITVRVADAVASAAATQFFQTHPNTIDVAQQADSVLLADRFAGLEFQRSGDTVHLARLYEIADRQGFLASGVVADDLFEMRMTLDPKHFGRSYDVRGALPGADGRRVPRRWGGELGVFNVNASSDE